MKIAIRSSDHVGQGSFVCPVDVRQDMLGISKRRSKVDHLTWGMLPMCGLNRTMSVGSTVQVERLVEARDDSVAVPGKHVSLLELTFSRRTDDMGEAPLAAIAQDLQEVRALALAGAPKSIEGAVPVIPTVVAMKGRANVAIRGGLVVFSPSCMSSAPTFWRIGG